MCAVGGTVLAAGGEKEAVHGPLPVLERGVVLGNFAARVVRVPAENLEREEEIEGGEFELKSV